MNAVIRSLHLSTVYNADDICIFHPRLHTKRTMKGIVLQIIDSSDNIGAQTRTQKGGTHPWEVYKLTLSKREAIQCIRDYTFEEL